MKIISGGKPGVGESALRVAARSGMEVAKVSTGIHDSDATLYIHDDREESPARILTRMTCNALGKPFMVFRLNAQDYHSKPPSDDARAILDFLSQHAVVNIAGDYESSSPGIGEATEEILGIVFGRLACVGI